MGVGIEMEMPLVDGVSLIGVDGKLSRYGRHDARDTTGGREQPSGQAAGAVDEP